MGEVVFEPRPKSGTFVWDLFLNARIDTNDGNALALELQRLQQPLTQARIELSDLADRKPENLLQLIRVAQLVIEYGGSRLRDTEDMLSKTQAQAQDYEIENRRLRNVGRTSTDPSYIEIRRLKDDMIRLEQQNVTSNRELERIEESLDAERAVVAQLTINLKEEKAKSSALHDTNRRLEEELKGIRDQITDQRTRLQSRNLDQDQFKMQLTEKNAELNRYVAEIQMLSTENANMATEFEAMAQELEVAMNELDRNGKELEEAQIALDSNTTTIGELTDERDALQIKVEDLAEQLERDGESHASNFDLLRDKSHGLQSRIASLESRIEQKNTLITKLEAEIVDCRAELTTTATEELKEEITRKDSEIHSLTLRLEESQKDFELLSIDWNRLDQIAKEYAQHKMQHGQENRSDAQGITANIRDQLDANKKLKEQAEVYRDNQKRDASKIKDLEDQLCLKEKDLIELREEADKYTGGAFGLKEATKEIKELKLQLRVRDRETAELAQEINDLNAQSVDLAEENNELRTRLGLSPDTAIDVSNLKKLKSVELEKEKSLNIRLREEIEKLEEERLQLKRALRMHAMERGERAIALGLTAKELTDIEEYADKLRLGQHPGQIGIDDSGGPTRPVLHIAQLDKLTLELERVHVDATEMRGNLMQQQRECSKLMDENNALQAAVLEISRTLIDHSIETRSDHAFPKVEALVSILQSRYQQTPIGDAMVNVERNAVRVARQLRQELEESRKQTDALRGVVDQRQTQINHAEKEIETLRTQLEKRQRRFVDIPSNIAVLDQDGVAALVDQLIGCLAEIKEKDEELAKSTTMLQKYEGDFEALHSKTQMLYIDYGRMRKDHEAEVERLKKLSDEAGERAHAAQHHANELQSLVDTIQKSTTDELRLASITAQRQLVVMQVNETTLKRRYLAISDVEQLLRKENKRLSNDMMQLDQSARETILRLHRQKTKAEENIETLQKQLSESVTTQQHELVENRLRTQVARTRLLLEREHEQIEHRIDQEDAHGRVISLERTIEKLSLDLKEARSKATHFEDILTSKIDNGTVSRDRHSVATLQVQVDVLIKRAELAEVKSKALSDVESELKSRLDAVDRMYMASKEECIHLQEELLDLRNSYTGGATRVEFEHTRASLRSMEDQINNLQADVQKFKDMADLASNQAADLEHLRKSDEKEISILRAAVQELQMEDDDKLIIGKLHHHILALQMSEAMALRKLEALSSKCLRLETSVLQMEQARDSRDQTIFSMRLDLRARLGTFQRTIAELRTRLAGVVLLSKHERACTTVYALDQRKREIELQLATVVAEKCGIEDRLNDASARLSAHDDLVAALKDNTNAQKHVLAWHEKMVVTQSSNTKLKRVSEEMTRRANVAERESASNQTRIMELETELTNIKNDFDQQQLDWEARQGELEANIQRYEEERDQIFQCTTATELKTLLPDRNLPIGQQLEMAIRLLVERGRLVKTQELTLNQLQDEVKHLKDKIKGTSDEILKKDSDIIGLQLAVAKAETKQFAERAEKSLAIDVSTFEVARERESEAIRVAKYTIDSLRRQIEQKEALVQKYRGMVQNVRKEVSAQKQAHKVELQNHLAAISDMRGEQIDRAVKIPDISPRVSQREVEHEQNAIAEMERLLAAKDTAIAAFGVQMGEAAEEASTTRKQLQDKIDTLRDELDQKELQFASMSAELDRVKQALTEVQGIASRPQPKDLSDVVQRLGIDIEQRDTKINNLTKAVQKLKTQLLSAAKEAAESKTSQSNENVNYQEQLEVKTSALTSKLIQLESKIKRMAGVIETHKQNEADLEIDLRRMSEELTRKEKELVEKSAENARLQQAQRDAGTNPTKNDGETKDGQSGDAHGMLSLPTLPLQSNQIVAGGSSASINAGGMIGADASRTAETIAKEKWEIEKKFICKIETLKSKLREKTQQADTAFSSIESLKQSLSRSENERLRLQSKISTLSQKLSSYKVVSGAAATVKSMTNGMNKSHGDSNAPKSTSDVTALTQMVQHLQAELAEQMRLGLEKTQELMQSRNEINQLQDRTKILGELNEQLRKSGSAFVVDGDEPTHDADAPRSPGIVLVLEARVRELMDKADSIENDRLRAETALVGAQFEAERSTSEAHRLKAKVAELEQTLKNYEFGVASLPAASASLYKTLGSKPQNELVAVIEHLTNVAEKLKVDNDQLRKKNVSQVKYAELVAENKRLKREHAELEQQKGERSNAGALATRDAAAMGGNQSDTNEMASKITRIEQENAKTRRQLRREMDKCKSLQVKIEELTLGREKLVREVATLRRALGGIDVHIASPDEMAAFKEQIVEMQKQLDEKEALVQKMMRPDASEQARLISENRRLSRELEVWTARANKLSEKLAQHDLGIVSAGEGGQWIPNHKKAEKRIAELEDEVKQLRGVIDEHAGEASVHQELEDLKYNFRECMKLNVMYEEQLKQLRSAGAVSLPY